MAADVRKDDTYADIESCSIFSDCLATEMSLTKMSDTSMISEFHNDEVPSHVIVFDQMKDVLEFQKAAAEQHIQSNISMNASRQSSLESQERTIRDLETSIQNDYIPKASFIEVEEKLKEERAKHKETLAHLSKTLDKLSLSQEKVAGLSLELEQEKSAFIKCSDSLRDDVQELKLKNRELKSLITEKTKQCEELKSEILKQNQQLNQLLHKNEKQRVKFKIKESESEVEKQQEAYLRQMAMEEKSKKQKGK